MDNYFYTWCWNEEPDFALPHADHIEVMDSEGEEWCILVVRHDVGNPEEARKRARQKAERIVAALTAYDEEDEILSLYHIDDPRSHG